VHSLCICITADIVPLCAQTELGDSDAEDFRSFIATLTAENSELKVITET
jgi:hypothetical protein